MANIFLQNQFVFHILLNRFRYPSCRRAGPNARDVGEMPGLFFASVEKNRAGGKKAFDMDKPRAYTARLAGPGGPRKRREASQNLVRFRLFDIVGEGKRNAGGDVLADALRRVQVVRPFSVSHRLPLTVQTVGDSRR